jgi:hypothetical protein
MGDKKILFRKLAIFAHKKCGILSLQSMSLKGLYFSLSLACSQKAKVDFLFNYSLKFSLTMTLLHLSCYLSSNSLLIQNIGFQMDSICISPAIEFSSAPK